MRGAPFQGGWTPQVIGSICVRPSRCSATGARRLGAMFSTISTAIAAVRSSAAMRSTEREEKE